MSRLQRIVDKLNKQYGERVVILGKDLPKSLPRISTGIFALDYAIGGGYPCNAIVELYGEPSTGKTTLSLIAAACLQKQGEEIFFIDAEGSFDNRWASAWGVDTDKLAVARPGNARVAGEIALEVLRSGGFGMLIIDSVPALVPTEEVEAGMEKDTIGRLPAAVNKLTRLITQALILDRKIGEKGPVVLMLNQIRAKIGVYGTPLDTPGGFQLKHHASVRIELRRSRVEDNLAPVSFRVVKNKTGPPMRTGKFIINLKEKCINDMEGIIELGLEHGYIKRDGAFYVFGKVKERGMEAFIKSIEQSGKARQQLMDKLREGL